MPKPFVSMRKTGTDSKIVKNDKYGKIIRIGNSRGILIPASFMNNLSLKEKDDVLFSIEDDKLIIKKLQPYTGPYTGIFADMPRPESGETGFFDGNSTDEIMKELRGGGEWREIPNW